MTVTGEYIVAEESANPYELFILRLCKYLRCRRISFLTSTLRKFMTSTQYLRRLPNSGLTICINVYVLLDRAPLSLSICYIYPIGCDYIPGKSVKVYQYCFISHCKLWQFCDGRKPDVKAVLC